VDCTFQIGKDVIAHLMATCAKHFGVRDFERCIEPTPKNDASDETAYGEYSKAQGTGRSPQNLPVFLEQLPNALHC
jgi:hypothetical protein